MMNLEKNLVPEITNLWLKPEFELLLWLLLLLLFLLQHHFPTSLLRL
jgi:hypothetical protein